MARMKLKIAALVILSAVSVSAEPSLATLAIPGPPEFARVARDVIALQIALDPGVASSAGLLEDATGVPASRVAELSTRLEVPAFHALAPLEHR